MKYACFVVCFLFINACLAQSTKAKKTPCKNGIQKGLLIIAIVKPKLQTPKNKGYYWSQEEFRDFDKRYQSDRYYYHLQRLDGLRYKNDYLRFR